MAAHATELSCSLCPAHRAAHQTIRLFGQPALAGCRVVTRAAPRQPVGQRWRRVAAPAASGPDQLGCSTGMRAAPLRAPANPLASRVARRTAQRRKAPSGLALLSRPTGVSFIFNLCGLIHWHTHTHNKSHAAFLRSSGGDADAAAKTIELACAPSGRTQSRRAASSWQAWRRLALTSGADTGHWAPRDWTEEKLLFD